jgi:hypothetical protein
LNNFIVPVAVRAFRIARIEGFSSFPIKADEVPTATPGGMRMVYSEDENDAPMCVESSFISCIRPGDRGYYVEYPDGHAVYWDAQAMRSAEAADSSLSYPTAFKLLDEGIRIYRKGWGVRGMYIHSTLVAGRRVIMLVQPYRQPREWTASNEDSFARDWAIYHDVN